MAQVEEKVKINYKLQITNKALALLHYRTIALLHYRTIALPHYRTTALKLKIVQPADARG